MYNQIFCQSRNAILKKIKKEEEEYDKDEERRKKNRKLIFSGISRMECYCFLKYKKKYINIYFYYFEKSRLF